MIHVRLARFAGWCCGLLLTWAGSAGAQQEAGADAPASTDVVELDEAAAFARARAHYEASNYKSCEQSFSDLLSPGAPNRLRSRELIEQARIYKAACLMGLGRPRDAEEQLKVVIRDNPLIAAPDPVVFPALFVDRFFAVRSQMLEEVRVAEERRVERLRREAEAVKQQDAAMMARLQQLERLAERETVVQKNSRWIAAVPFGVGQFQNRDPGWGWFFLTSEVLLAGAATAAVSVQLSLHAQANGGNTTKDTEVISDRLQLAHKIEVASLAGLVGLATLGIVQAQLAFVPEFRLAERARANRRGSSKPTVVPTAAPTSGGAILGLSGRF